MNAAGPLAALHRLARLLALAIFVLYQPLAAFHFATDEAHIANAATSIQVAGHGGHAHAHPDDPTGGHHHPSHDEALCDFCLLAGAALAPLAGTATLAAAWDLPPDLLPAEAVRPQQRLRIGHPVRAPPPVV